MSRTLLAIALLLLTGSAWAGGVSVLGFEISKTSLDAVKTSVSKKAELTFKGNNRASKGPMYTAPGSAFDIEGLHRVIFVFDDSQTLQCVILTMDKSRFDTVLEHLRAKYTVVASDISPVGRKFVHLHGGTTTIELSAPHMSFEMDVRYLDDAMVEAFDRITSQDKADQDAKEAAKF